MLIVECHECDSEYPIDDARIDIPDDDGTFFFNCFNCGNKLGVHVYDNGHIDEFVQVYFGDEQ